MGVSKHWERALLGVFCLWMACGVFPLVCYESDSMHVVAGCSVMFNQGWTLPPVYSYSYDMQPLATVVVTALRWVLPFSCEQIYCALATLAAYAVVFGVVRLVRRLAGVPLWGAVVLLVLYPEAAACGMYPNTAVLAMACFVWGLCLVERRWAFLALLAVAPMFRIDVVIVYPVVLPLLMMRRGFRESLLLSAATAVVVVAALVAGYWLMGANPLASTLAGYEEFAATPEYARATKFAIYTFYTVVNVVLVPLGAVVLCRRRRWVLLAVCLVPMVLLHWFFRSTGCATKHWLYLLPFAMTLSAWGGRSLLARAGRRRWMVAVAVAVYLLVSVRFHLPMGPWLSEPGSEGRLGPCVTLFGEERTPLRVRVGVGAGQLVPTYDEYMLLSGGLFYPFYIYNYKVGKDAFRREAYRKAEAMGEYDMVMLRWGDIVYMTNLMLDDGWALERTPGRDTHMVLRRGGRTVRCYYNNIGRDDMGALRSYLKGLEPSARPRIVVTEPESCEWLLSRAAREGLVRRVGRRMFVVGE